MGEIAEMMLDGTLCASCGEYLFGDGIDGIPSYCPGCVPDWHVDDFGMSQAERGKQRRQDKKFHCDQCNKRFYTKHARRQHLRDKHGVSS